MEAVPHLTDLLKAPQAELRRLAVEALTQLRGAAALEALRSALKDSDRDVRVAAARGLAAANYGPARSTLEALVSSRTLRAADLTEKIAFFEAFGSVAGMESLELLDRLLNGRRLLKRESPEIRACAAMALGRIGNPAARASLLKASGDSSPMVRNAVANALRAEVTAS
jgi:HEAT repeat protein